MQQQMTLNDFMDRFLDEKSCREHLFDIKWTDGFECPKCYHDEL